MSLSTKDLVFIEKRERLTKYWPLAGAGLLTLLSAFSIWLWAEVPHMINPWFVSASINNGTLPETTVTTMAVILPFVMLSFLVFAGIVVLLAFVAFANERRLLRLIRKLEAPGDIGSNREN